MALGKKLKEKEQSKGKETQRKPKPKPKRKRCEIARENCYLICVSAENFCSCCCSSFCAQTFWPTHAPETLTQA